MGKFKPFGVVVHDSIDHLIFRRDRSPHPISFDINRRNCFGFAFTSGFVDSPPGFPGFLPTKNILVDFLQFRVDRRICLSLEEINPQAVGITFHPAIMLPGLPTVLECSSQGTAERANQLTFLSHSTDVTGIYVPPSFVSDNQGPQFEANSRRRQSSTEGNLAFA